MYGEFNTPAKRLHQRSDITSVSGITIVTEGKNMRTSVDTLVFTLVVIAAFVGLWADTVRAWLVW